MMNMQFNLVSTGSGFVEVVSLKAWILAVPPVGSPPSAKWTPSRGSTLQELHLDQQEDQWPHPATPIWLLELEVCS